MKVEYDFRGERKIVEIDNDESEAKIREREYILYTYLEKSPVENISGIKRIPKSARTTYIADAKKFFKRVLDKGLIVSEKSINPFNIDKQNIDFLKNILDNVWNVESYKKIDSSISSNAPRAFLQHLIDFVERFTMPQIWWLCISEKEQYWKEKYPFDKWRLGTNNDMIVYEHRDNVKEGDIAIFYFTDDIKAVRYIGRVYKIDEDIYFDMLLKIEKDFDLQEIRNINGLENYPPQGGFSKMGNQQIALELVIKCFENGQSQQNIIANQNSKENESALRGISIKAPPLNQILYGPPGTGKTYNTINKALEVLGEQIEGKDRAELKAKFDEYRQNGQIKFVTFHQSFSYEEFVEGIKPNTDNPANMIYEPKAGIFKEICKSALANLQDSQNTKEILQDKENFENKLDEFLSDLVENQITIEKSNVGSFQISGFDDDKIYISTQDTKISLSLYMDFLKKVLQSGESFDTSKEMMLKIANKKNQWQSSTYYFQLYKLFKDFKPSKIAQNVDKVILKPYILIIDEINRGNISKILGELITLIEPSKRIGANDEDKARGIGNESLEVTLPYSNDSFGVPSNLYIIGTMNTADRSIALLDTALRRRFEFVEMMPEWDNEHISTNCEGVNLQKLLKAMNERIEFLLDRERTIGHSFFIGVDSLDRLCEVFKLKIIPLLQEYFYDDYAKIDAVLNGNGIVVSKSMSDLGVRLSEDFVDSEKRVYRITESSAWNATTFTKIYE